MSRKSSVGPDLWEHVLHVWEHVLHVNPRAVHVLPRCLLARLDVSLPALLSQPFVALGPIWLHGEVLALFPHMIMMYFLSRYNSTKSFCRERRYVRRYQIQVIRNFIVLELSHWNFELSP